MKLGALVYSLFSGATAVLAYTVNVHEHSSCPLVWAFIDFFLPVTAWLKWLVCHDVSLSIIKEAFAFFLA